MKLLSKLSIVLSLLFVLSFAGIGTKVLAYDNLEANVTTSKTYEEEPLDYDYEGEKYVDNYLGSDSYEDTDSADEAFFSGFMLVMVVFYCCAGIFALAAFIFNIIMLVDCIQREFDDRTIWLVLLIGGLLMGFGWIAALVYYFMVKKKDLGTKK